jgi:hypothetical protein
MRKTMWLVGAAGVVVALLGVLLWQQMTPPPSPAPTATATLAPPTDTAATATPVPPPATIAPATVTTAPTAVPTLPPITPNTTGQIGLGAGATITLAPGWVGAQQPAPAALGFADPNGAPLLAAWYGADTYQAAPQRLTVIRTARAGIPLATYLSDLAAALAATPGLTITDQTVTDTLRSDGLPAGLLSFTQAAPPAHGWQAVLIDPTGESLLLLTLVANEASADVAGDDFRAVIKSVAFE